jgi:hypothetical protein
VSARPAALALLGGILVAALGTLGVALDDGSRLGVDALDPWLVVYAIGLLVALGSLPFLLHERYTSLTDDRERRWELALAAWGGIALAGAVAFVLVGVVGGFGTDTAPGSLAIVGIAACGLVVGALATLILTTG